MCVCVRVCVCACVRSEAAASDDLHLRLGAGGGGRKISAGEKISYVSCTQRDAETVRPVRSSFKVVQSAISVIAVTLVALVALTRPFDCFSSVFIRNHSPSIFNTSTSDNVLFFDDQAFSARVFNASPWSNESHVDVIRSPAGACNERDSCLHVDIWHSCPSHRRHALTHAQSHTQSNCKRARARARHPHTHTDTQARHAYGSRASGREEKEAERPVAGLTALYFLMTSASR